MDEKNLSFPLPLTCFEEYLFSEDRPAYPMTVMFKLRLSGFLEQRAFDEALSLVLPRHPLLRAIVSRGRSGGLTWRDCPGWRPAINWGGRGDGDGFPEASFMDLTREPGMRVWCFERDTGHDLVMQIHHCCTDGKGLLLFMEDLLLAYAMRQGAPAGGIGLRRLETGALRRRSVPRLTGMKRLEAVVKQIGVLPEVLMFLLRTPAPLTDGRLPAFENRRAEPRFFRFDCWETERIAAAAGRCGATLHELLLRDLLLAVGTWRGRRGVGRPGELLRFTMPVNLRGPGEEMMPMANCISLKFLDLQSRDLRGRESLLRLVMKFMKSINRLYRKYTFIFSVGVTRFLPGGISRFTREDACYATACFSNVGRVLDRIPLPRSGERVVAGNVLVESVDIVPSPLRPSMHASFVAYTYAGCLQVGVNYDAAVLSRHDARELLQGYVDEVRRSMGENDVRQPGSVS